MIITHNGAILTNDGVVLNNIITSSSFTNTYSLNFDGVDDYINIGNNITELQPTGAFSISLWCKFDGLTGYQGLIEATSNVGAYGNDGYLIWKHTSTNKLQFYIRQGGAWKIATSTTVVTTGTWYHILATWDGSATSTIYINGVSEGTQSVTSITYNANTGHNIGGYQSEGGTPYLINGKIDEVSFWDNDQSANVSTIYNSGEPTDLTSLNPIAWYRMGDNSLYKDPQWLIPNNENKDKVSNYSMSFDGTDDYINTGASTLSGETALTISAWVYPTAYGDATAPSFVSTDEASPRAFYLGLYNGTNFRFSMSTNGANLNSLDTAIGTVTLNAWQHILVTWDKVNTKFYKNGVLLKTVATTFANNQDFTTTNDLLIGARRSSTGFFEGNIDEVAIWDSDQSANISTISSNPLNDLTSLNPIAYYKMGENATFSTNWTVPDQIGSNDGTSANMDINNRIGDAPGSENNALSYNMVLSGRTSDVPT